MHMVTLVILPLSEGQFKTGHPSRASSVVTPVKIDTVCSIQNMQVCCVGSSSGPILHTSGSRGPSTLSTR